mmetsp:Transcript_69218/g.154420  ORF Transcript_69218/g.154420 Transcript_69218/m.154420 type:complete len:399 (-) Transcript_69218:301-1497(-)
MRLRRSQAQGRPSLGAIPRPEILWAPLRCKLTGLLHVVIDLKGIQNCLVHVEVLVGSEAAYEAYALLGFGQLAVALVKSAVLWVGHRVVRVSHGRRDFFGDQGTLDLPLFDGARLVRHVLVLHDAREIDIGGWVVDDHCLLEVPIIRFLDPLLVELDAAVLQPRHTLLREVAVYGASVHEHAVLWQLALLTRLKEVHVQADGDVGVEQQHVLKDARVAVHRQCLILIVEVAIVGRRAARQTHQHGRVEFGWVLVPLLLGVVLKDPLVQPLANPREGSFLAVGRLSAGWLDPLRFVPRRHRLIGIHTLAEERVDCLLDWRDGHQLLDAILVRDHALHPVVERHPLGELLDVVPHPLELGVKQMCTVLGRPDAMRINVVVAISADVVTHVDDEGRHPQLL